MFHAARVRVARDPAGELRHRQLPVGGDEDRVAESFAPPHHRVGRQGHFGEAGGGGGDLAPQVGQRRAVRQVRHVPPGGREGPAHVVQELGAGQVRGGAGAAEHVRDDQVRPAVGNLGQPGPRVHRPDADPRLRVQRQVFPYEGHQGGVDLHHLLGGAGAARRGVAGQGQGPAAQVHHVQGAAGGRDEVDEVADAPLVGEVEVEGVGQVDVRLRGPVDEQGPRPGALTVGGQLRVAAVHLSDDRLTGPAPLALALASHGPSMPGGPVPRCVWAGQGLSGSCPPPRSAGQPPRARRAARRGR